MRKLLRNVLDENSDKQISPLLLRKIKKNEWAC
jgi:hypothetical protein